MRNTCAQHGDYFRGLLICNLVLSFTSIPWSIGILLYYSREYIHQLYGDWSGSPPRRAAGAPMSAPKARAERHGRHQFPGGTPFGAPGLNIACQDSSNHTHSFHMFQVTSKRLLAACTPTPACRRFGLKFSKTRYARVSQINTYEACCVRVPRTKARSAGGEHMQKSSIAPLRSTTDRTAVQ